MEPLASGHCDLHHLHFLAIFVSFSACGEHTAFSRGLFIEAEIPKTASPFKFVSQVAIVELPFGFVSNTDSVGGAGGTCVIRGCVPKKLMVYASEFSEGFHDAQGFGWGPAAPSHDLGSFIARKVSFLCHCLLALSN
jgi:hypothetical protein